METDIVEKLYNSKSSDYFSLEREIIINEVNGNNLIVLDIGCGSGELGEALKKKSKTIVYGVELNKKAYEKASLKLDHAIHANIESVKISYEKQSFDYIIMGDVLEHLIDPMSTLKKLKPYLKKEGSFLLTVPNIRYWKTLIDLVLKDEWEYKDWGILDFTHLRFFTKKSLFRLFFKMDFNHLSVSRVIGKNTKSDFLNKLTLGLFEGFLASHIFVRAKK